VEVEYEHIDDIKVQCPHCKQIFPYHYEGRGMVEVEPPERDEDG